jgi:NAD(P)-dependent dehydrogenase (short-subunit alcohol dehydrogenase family)
VSPSEGEGHWFESSRVHQLPQFPQHHAKTASAAENDGANSLLRRLGEPEDIANACLWLCSDASGYVTGQTIGVNGGSVVS